ncbi:ABC transporter substrate-binding protein [Terrisporobacter sp.]|uniref:ABC transporter substrate-binding protein n=1 Tax=Terrisporobacter sp. TaxID=1965305 RepID=UPI002607CA1A|nr:ABC transporter substrate-binding protein [Terrisporobacter sp.]
MKFKKLTALGLTFALSASMLVGCGGGKKSAEVLNIYNVGDYIDEELIEKFEEETGIQVVYDTYDTNEGMYQKLKSGSTNYDLIFPSDYMVEKLIEEDLISEIDYANIPNYEKNMMDSFKDSSYDAKNKHSVPYLWGTFGIVYNKTMVDEADLKGWDVLWNKKYEGQIQMLDSVRDTMGIALMKLGYSINTKDSKEIEQAKKELIKQLPLVQAYVNDDGKDRIVAGDAAMGVYYSGDASVMMSENKDLGYYIPETGTNKWIDAMCIPKIAENKKEAEQFINFMLDAENALKNVEYIQYSTPNQATYDLLSDEMKNDPTAYPSDDIIGKSEVFLNLPKDVLKLYDDAWTEIKSQ